MRGVSDQNSWPGLRYADWETCAGAHRNRLGGTKSGDWRGTAAGRGRRKTKSGRGNKRPCKWPPGEMKASQRNGDKSRKKE